MTKLLDELSKILQERKLAGDADGSYVASLHAKGLNKILEKVGEEATETILAAKELDHNAAATPSTSNLKQDLIAETADLWFHTLIMLSHFNLEAEDILQELARRQGLSGLEEKASRTQK